MGPEDSSSLYLGDRQVPRKPRLACLLHQREVGRQGQIFVFRFNPLDHRQECIPPDVRWEMGIPGLLPLFPRLVLEWLDDL